MAEEVKEKVEEAPGEVKAEETVTVIEPAGAVVEQEQFEKHVYECPMCHKRLRVHFDDDCGCDSKKDILTLTLGFM